MRELRKEKLKIEGGEIYIVLYFDEKYEDYLIAIDDVEWCTTKNRMHAVVLFEMMWQHILEYMKYKAK